MQTQRQSHLSTLTNAFAYAPLPYTQGQAYSNALTGTFIQRQEHRYVCIYAYTQRQTHLYALTSTFKQIQSYKHT